MLEGEDWNCYYDCLGVNGYEALCPKGTRGSKESTVFFWRSNSISSEGWEIRIKPFTFYYRFEAISGEHYSWGYFSREDMKETIMEILKIYERISREKQEMISEDREFTNEELKLGE